MGRYIESDPIGLNGGLGSYAYAGANPVNRSDATGEFAFLVIPGICAAGGCEAIAAALGLTVYMSTPTGQKAASDAAAAAAAIAQSYRWLHKLH